MKSPLYIKNPKQFYIVECPYCWAAVGKPCFQKSIFERRAVKKWSLVHMARRRIVNKKEQTISDPLFTSNWII